MFLTQHFVPRWTKEWLPLATQQLRLRNLKRILAFGIKNDKRGTIRTKNNDDGNCHGTDCESYYFTLHATTMSAPFYTSEKLTGDSPKWKELNISMWEGNVCNSIDALVIRLWFSCSSESEDKVLEVWGIYLSGLMYLGPKLRTDLQLKPNSIVLVMPGGYFTDANCLETNSKLRYTSVIVKNCDVRQSYSVSSLRRLQTLQHVIKKEMAEAEMLKKKISMGDFFRYETRGRTSLRKLLSKHKPKTNHVELTKVKESIEITKYRVNILKKEKETLQERIKNLNIHIKKVSEGNQLLESKILENVKQLKKDIYNHKEWKKSYIDRREKFLHSKAMLNFRKKQLISELNWIYPIIEVSQDKFTICGVHLPNSEDFAGHDDLKISIALGFVTHIIQMISVFLQIPLRYPVVHYGSRSRIIDQITDKISDSEREFCLFSKGKEKLQFHYAVYLLNKNIAQMRWLCGLPTSDLRNTLENLSSLVKMKVGSTTLDQCSRSVSSSTADICSSNVSVSSPIGSVMSFQSKKFQRTPNLSETRGDFNAKTATSSYLRVPGHRFSKSVGSSKDFVTNLLSPKNKHFVGNKNPGNNGLSCSLDKGLNEFEGAINSRRKELEQFGSEPTLNTNSRNVPSNLRPADKSVESWKPESPKNKFLDDELEENVTEIGFKTRENFNDDNMPRKDFKDCYSSFADDKSDIDQAIEVVSDSEKNGEEVELENTTGHSNESFLFDNDKNSVTLNVSPHPKPVDNVKTCESPSKDKDPMGDSLLESVTNRTQALVHQTTSFNRFRTRFKSTLESSN